MIESSKSKSPGRVRATQPNKSAKSGANPSWPSTELRLLHPKNAEPRSNGGAERARAPARAFTNSTASWLHLPLFPGPRPPIYSGLPQRVPGISAFLSRRARCKTAPLVCAALAQAMPWVVNGLRMVTSIANCAPWNSGSPLANTSIEIATFMSRSFVLQRTEAPASRHTRAKLRSGPSSFKIQTTTAFTTCVGDIKWEAQSLHHEGAEEMWFHNEFWLGRNTAQDIAGTWA